SSDETTTPPVPSPLMGVALASASSCVLAMKPSSASSVEPPSTTLAPSAPSRPSRVGATVATLFGAGVRVAGMGDPMAVGSAVGVNGVVTGGELVVVGSGTGVEETPAVADELGKAVSPGELAPLACAPP